MEDKRRLFIWDGFSLKGILSEQTETEAFLQEYAAYVDTEPVE